MKGFDFFIFCIAMVYWRSFVSYYIDKRLDMIRRQSPKQVHKGCNYVHTISSVSLEE